MKFCYKNCKYAVKKMCFWNVPFNLVEKEVLAILIQAALLSRLRQSLDEKVIFFSWLKFRTPAGDACYGTQ